MTNFDYATLESRLRQAHALVRPQLKPSDAAEALGYLDVGEYGLAFETLAWSIVYDALPMSKELCGLLKDAAHRMGYTDDRSGIASDELKATLALIWEACGA